MSSTAIAKSPEQKERERCAAASKVCPCGNDASDMLKPGVGACSVCYQRTCSADCGNRHTFTVHERSERGAKWLAVNGFDDVQYASQNRRRRKQK